MNQSTYLLVVIFTFCLILPINAQQYYVGVIGGLNVADYNISFHEDVEPQHDVHAITKFSAGAVLGVKLVDFLSLQLEPMYLVHGGIYRQESNPDAIMKASVLELPLFLKAAYGEKIQPYIFAGPILDIVLASEGEYESYGLVFKGDLDNMLKQTMFGLGLGAGISVPMWKGSVFLEGRYSFGLTNLNKGGAIELKRGNLVIPGPETVPEDEIKTKGTQIMLGYTLPFGGK